MSLFLNEKVIEPTGSLKSVTKITRLICLILKRKSNRIYRVIKISYKNNKTNMSLFLNEKVIESTGSLKSATKITRLICPYS